MPSPMNGVQPPYTLPSNTVYFLDWRYVDGGLLRWLDENDEPISLMPPPDPMPPVHANWDNVAHGVRIEVLPAQVDAEPVLTATALGEPLFFPGNVLLEDGRYRMYYESVRPEVRANPSAADMNFNKLLRYAESEDGIQWCFPQLGIVGNQTSKQNNIVFDPGAVGYHGGHVFSDPSSTDERYKTLFLGRLSREELERYLAARPGDTEPFALARHAGSDIAAYALFGAVSPDGFHWSPREEPLLVHFSDTMQACTYNETLGKYIAYLRSWYYGRRTVAWAASDDFRRFTPAEQMLWPDGNLAPHETWYTPGYVRMPEAPDYHLLFPVKWSQWDDTFTPYLYSSPDGLLWSQVPGGPAAPHGPAGSWYRCGMGICNLVPLPGDRIGSLVGGWHVPHKYPRRLPFGQVGWVSWQQGRLAALRADGEGRFSLYPLHFQGRQVVLNFRTKIAGSIRVEVAGIEGRSFADCDALNGDSLRQVVMWRGQSDIGHQEGEPVQLRFRLNNADLFSVSFA